MLFMIFSSFTVFFFFSLRFAMRRLIHCEFSRCCSLLALSFSGNIHFCWIFYQNTSFSPRCGGFSSFSDWEEKWRITEATSRCDWWRWRWCTDAVFFFLCQMHLSLSLLSLAQLQLSTVFFFSVSRKSLSMFSGISRLFLRKACARVHFFHTRPCRLHYSAFWLAFFSPFPKKKTTEPHRPREKSDSAYIRRARTHKTQHTDDRETVDDDVGDGGDI